MNNFLTNYFGKSIKRLVMASLVFVLLLPIGFFVYSLFQNSWQQVEQRMVEKHHLISEALIEPFTLFVSTRQQALHTLGQELLSLDPERYLTAPSRYLAKHSREHKAQLILDKNLNSFGSFVAISYTSDANSRVLESSSTTKSYYKDSEQIGYSSLTLSELPAPKHNSVGQDLISPVFKSAHSGGPVILIQHQIFDIHQKAKGMIYAEVSLDQIGEMCSKINFGVKGHCAVVDNTGQVVAHPNKDWTFEIKSLANVSIVKKMLAGESGTTEFYSPFLKADMVAGFSPIPALGWGVMIPQPKSELTNILDNARLNTMIWLLIGALVALIVSAFLTRKITQPINLLSRLTHKPDKDYEAVRLGLAPSNTPVEIKQLWASFSNLLSGLQTSNKEIKRLNISLQDDIQQATAELQEMNNNLYITSSQDYLTSLSNRRHFTLHLETVLKNNVGESIGIIMIDVDKFKHLNDHYGHEVGDLALKHLADILKRATRPCDLVARLGGDEFIIYVQNPSDQSLSKCSEDIRSSMELSPLVLAKEIIRFTLSIGTVRHRNNGALSLVELLRFADHAMYDSKSLGRNQVSSYQSDATAMES